MISGSRITASTPPSVPAGPAGGWRSVLIEDAATQAALQPAFAMQCYQLSPGRRVGRLDSLCLGRQRIVRERQDTAVQKLGATPANLCTLSHCTPDPAFRFSDRAGACADTLFFMPEHTEFDLHVPAGARTFYISVDQDAFLHAARALDPAGWERAPRHLTAFRLAGPGVLGAAVDLWLETARLSAARGEAPDPAVMSAIVLQSVLQGMTAAAPDAPRPPSRVRALRICTASRDVVAARFEAGALPTVVDICAAVGVCERTLQYAFRDYVGMSPLAYLRLCRLNRARATLLAASPATTTVTQVAMQFGFLHLGRFAGDYKRVFEQTPSVTLAS